MSNEDVPSMAWLPTSRGEFKIEVFHEDATGLDHVALTPVSYTHLTLPTTPYV